MTKLDTNVRTFEILNIWLKAMNICSSFWNLVGVTFSKSYKPFGSKNKTGALKIYQMSPTASKNDIKKYIQQLILLKIKFDEKHSMIKEDAIQETFLISSILVFIVSLISYHLIKMQVKLQPTT